MTTQLEKINDRWAIFLDDATMRSLAIDPAIPLHVDVEEGRLTLTAEVERQERFEAALLRMNERYGTALQKLAE